jgi:uracil-DNA glycosylase family 4
MNKQKALDRIAQEIEQCLECKIGKSGKAVPGEGDPDADIIFMGEAPGKTEAKMGRPFIGRSGQLLRALIREAGLREEDVYITSPVKYLPDRGTPTPKDIAHAKTHLEKYVGGIKGDMIVELCLSCTRKIVSFVVRQGCIGNKNLRYCCSYCKQTGKIEVDDEERSDLFRNYKKHIECKECQLP